MNAAFRLAAAFLVAAASSTIVAAQSDQAPTPTFRANIEYVEVDVLVTDQQGQFVRGLTQGDFQVFEDGKLQEISTFSVVDIPIGQLPRPLFSSTAIEPDVRSNQRPFDGRVYVMVLDDYHVAPLRSQRVKMAARDFIERYVGANDLMAVIYTGGRAQDAQEFTSSKRLLLNAVDRFIGQKLPAATLSRNEEYFRRRDAEIPDSRVPDPDEQQRGHRARSTLRSLRQVADWFGSVHGRKKTMLFISEGIDYDVSNVLRTFDSPGTSATGIISDIRDTIAATARSNVSIYAIDPRGLATSVDDTIEVGQFADADQPNIGIGARSLANELRMQQNDLRMLAAETGGFAVVNRNDYSSAFERIVSDNSSYYVLAYYPPSAKRDGKFHKIEVKTTRPGLSIRARRGYVAPRGKPTAPKTGSMPLEIYEAINSPIPVSGVSMRVFAAPFKGPSPNASVLVGLEMLGRSLTLDRGKVDISYLAVDAKSKVYGQRNDVLTLALRPETRARVEASGLRVLRRMELPAGRYQLRIATRDQGRSALGSVIYDLDVPDFYKEPFSMSGLMITSLGGGALVTAQPDEQASAVLPAPPIGQRTFPQNDEIALFVEVYDNANKTPHKVDITTSVLTDEGRVLYKNEETRDSSELQGAKGAYGYSARVPLAEIAPGSYVLQVEAKSRLEKDSSAKRQVQIVIQPTAAR